MRVSVGGTHHCVVDVLLNWPRSCILSVTGAAVIEVSEGDSNTEHTCVLLMEKGNLLIP